MSFERAELKEMAIAAIDCLAEMPGLEATDIDALIDIGTHALKRATALRPSVPPRPLAYRAINPPSRL